MKCNIYNNVFSNQNNGAPLKKSYLSFIPAVGTILTLSVSGTSFKPDNLDQWDSIKIEVTKVEYDELLDIFIIDSKGFCKVKSGEKHLVS